MQKVRGRRHPVLTSEHVEQVIFVAWFRKTFPGIKMYAVLNGSARDKVAGAKLKAEGVDKGVPDLCIPAWFAYIEMKRRKGGSLSSSQKEYRDYLIECGYKWFRCNGADEAKEAALSTYLEVKKSPPRGWRANEGSE